MRHLKVYLSSRAMIVSFIVLAICVLLALKGFSEAQTWFRLLSPTGLKETQAKTTNLQQNANSVSISYAYNVENANGVTTPYTNTLNISDVSLDIDNMAQEFQSTIPVEYLPDVPSYSIVSKQRWPEIYYKQLEDSIVNKWWNGLLIPAIFTMLSLFCFIFLLWKGKNLFRTT